MFLIINEWCDDEYYYEPANGDRAVMRRETADGLDRPIVIVIRRNYCNEPR